MAGSSEDGTPPLGVAWILGLALLLAVPSAAKGEPNWPLIDDNARPDLTVWAQLAQTVRDGSDAARERATRPKPPVTQNAPATPATPLAPEPAREIRFREIRFYEDIDFFGHDLSWRREETLQGCEAACRLDGECRAFTYNRTARACFLKSGYSRIERYPNAVSAVLVGLLPLPDIPPATMAFRTNIDFEGGDYGDYRPVSFHECYTICERAEQCVAFSYITERRWCWVKSRLNSPVPREGVVSGVKP